MKITTLIITGALALSAIGCSGAASNSSTTANTGTANRAANTTSNSASTSQSGASSTASSSTASLPEEIKVGEEVYKRIPTTDAKLNAGILEKYFKGLSADKVSMEFYAAGDKKSPVMIGKYDSAEAATKAMSEAEAGADADDNIWTKGNMLFVSDNAGFKNKF